MVNSLMEDIPPELDVFYSNVSQLSFSDTAKFENNANNILGKLAKQWSLTVLLMF